MARRGGRRKTELGTISTAIPARMDRLSDGVGDLPRGDPGPGVAFFYAIGTGVGGIVGPLMFGSFIESGDRALVGTGFLIAVGVMAVGGIAEIFLGVDAEGRSLEDIAAPITAADPDADQRPGTRKGADQA